MCSTISKVIIREGILESDPSIWEITINGKVLKVDSEHILSLGAFGNQFIKAFHVPMPEMESKDWKGLIAVLGESAEIVKTSEESEKVYIARQVFEEICNMQIGERETTAVKGKHLVEYEGYYCLASKKIEEIIAAHGYRITTKDLSNAMVELGMKKEGTERIYFGSKQSRAWHFIKEVVDEYKGTTNNKNEVERTRETAVSQIEDATA